MGAGPTGLAVAVLLAQRGVPVLVLERQAAPYALPRGVHLDDEVHRLLQRLGVADDFARISSPAAGMRLVDADHRVLAEFRRSGGTGVHGWPQANLFDQPDLEALLRARLDALGVPVRHGAEVLRVDPTGPAVTYRQDGTVVDVAAAAVLACDGAASPLRGQLGLGWRVLGRNERWMVVDLRSPRPLDVWDGVVQRCDPVRPATFVRVGPGRYRCELRLPPGETAAQTGLDRLLPPWTGGAVPADLEVLRVAEYVFGAGVARRWRQGLVLLLGDAAHLTPPFTGQGLGAGLRDADNLAWKLTRVLQDGAPEALLDTYQQERAPHVRGLVRLAVLVGRLVNAGGPLSAGPRRLALRLLPRLPGLRARVLDSATPALRGGPLAGRGLVGTLLPQPRVRAGGRRVRLDDLLGPGLAVLTRVPPDPALLELAADLGAPVLGLAGVRGPGVLALDDDGGLLAGSGASAVVVRPDRAVLAVARSRSPGTELRTRRAAALTLLGASPDRVTHARRGGVEVPP